MRQGAAGELYRSGRTYGTGGRGRRDGRRNFKLT